MATDDQALDSITGDLDRADFYREEAERIILDLILAERRNR